MTVAAAANDRVMTPKERFEAASFIQYLDDNGHRSIRAQPKTMRWFAIYRFAFTWAIQTGRIGDWVGIEDRWCFSTEEKARAALDAWEALEFEGEPTGWHRHPHSGRRREGGDPELETVEP